MMRTQTRKITKSHWLNRVVRSAALWSFAAGIASADIRLPAIIGSHMVIQQEGAAPIWGWADPGEAIEVKASWSSNTEKVIAGAEGKWRVSLQTPAAGGPH
jgi:sialate O-acetylesterase